jgi:hypothetical protein
MAFTDYFAPIRRVGQQHRGVIIMFNSTLALLVTGELCLREVVTPSLAPSFEGVAAALLQPLGVLGLGFLLAGLLLWALLLVRHQLSFFYPLWGLGSVALLGLYWVRPSGWVDPKALFGALLVLVGAGLLMRGGHSRN